MRISTIPIALATAAALTLAACGEEEPEAPIGGEQTFSEEPSEMESPHEQPSDTGSPTGAGGQPSETPAADECVPVQAAADGSYQVFEAGTASATVDGDRLSLGDVRPGQGWQQSVDTEEDDKVEVEFQRDGESLDLEVELADGQTTAEVCNDDD